DGATPAAALVPLFDEKKKFLATAISSSSSQIALRVISNDPLEEHNLHQFIRERIRAAAAYREQVYPSRDAYRVIFSESDRLPGLVVDKYRDVLSMQLLTQFMGREDVRATIIAELEN